MSTIGNKRVSKALELINGVNCSRALVVGEEGSVHERLESELGFRY